MANIKTLSSNNIEIQRTRKYSIGHKTFNRKKKIMLDFKTIMPYDRIKWNTIEDAQRKKM